MARAVILAATIAALICLYLDRPKPVQSVETKYCAQQLYFAQREVLVTPDGAPVIRDGKLVERWRKFWAPGYGLCSQRDRYEEA